MVLAWRSEKKRKRASNGKNKESEGDKETNKREYGQYTIWREERQTTSEGKENTRWRVHR